MRPKSVCLDFDGVMSDYHSWQGPEVLDPPRPGLDEFLKALQDAGYDVLIHTTRSPYKIRHWLEENGLSAYVAAVHAEKPPAFVYIDDRAICFRGDYAETLTAIEAFHAYWEKSKV